MIKEMKDFLKDVDLYEELKYRKLTVDDLSGEEETNLTVLEKELDRILAPTDISNDNTKRALIEAMEILRKFNGAK